MDADELLTNVTVMQEMMTDVVAFRQLQQHTTTHRPKDLFFLFFLLFFSILPVILILVNKRLSNDT